MKAAFGQYRMRVTEPGLLMADMADSYRSLPSLSIGQYPKTALP